jgi:hypothetical protein
MTAVGWIMTRTLLFLTLLCGLMPLSAAGDKPPQQARTGVCNRQAAGMTGDTRKTFMNHCLLNVSMSQQDRTKLCNATAGARTGEDRKVHMSRCLRS